MFTQTASIGNAVLISSLYTQKNHYKFVEKKTVNEFDSGCFACPHFRTPDCEACTNKVYDTSFEKIYINEKNRFGTRKNLKRNAILLFMYFHFLGPDKNGLIQFDAEEAAEKLNCNEKSIYNNLKLLSKNSYITYSPGTYPGAFNVFILDYNSYFKKAESGGRGYSVISSSIFDQLTEMKDINTIRLSIRNLVLGSSYLSDPKKSYDELKRCLPKYCTKEKIRSITGSKQFTNIFNISQKKRYINIIVKEQFNPVSIANHLREDCKIAVLEKIDSINKFVVDNKLRFKINLNNNDLTDIINIALRIPIRFICEAFDYIYKDYISHNQHVSNMGALVRTIAEYNAEVAALN